MPSTISEVVFSKPSGRSTAILQFAGSLIFLGLYVYSRTVGNAGSSSWLLIMVIGSALAGIAESLPKNRRLTAGLFRLAAVLVLLCLLAASVFRPEFIIG
ncbi:hypothetical protein [Natrinema salinisoli]|uniref:hypothetical protein n=1 Tax=Natrinema salinisoli TaxID=2878535 RepID=UPI001CF019F2|nr:hypothetical protein [Natrinema salinisoli]